MPSKGKAKAAQVPKPVPNTLTYNDIFGSPEDNSHKCVDDPDHDVDECYKCLKARLSNEIFLGGTTDKTLCFLALAHLKRASVYREKSGSRWETKEEREVDEAEVLSTNALQRTADHPFAYLLLGCCEIFRENLVEAASFLREANELACKWNINPGLGWKCSFNLGSIAEVLATRYQCTKEVQDKLLHFAKDQYWFITKLESMRKLTGYTFAEQRLNALEHGDGSSDTGIREFELPCVSEWPYGQINAAGGNSLADFDGRGIDKFVKIIMNNMKRRYGLVDEKSPLLRAHGYKTAPARDEGAGYVHDAADSSRGENSKSKGTGAGKGKSNARAKGKAVDDKRSIALSNADDPS